jgi:hypothetical protein
LKTLDDPTDKFIDVAGIKGCAYCIAAGTPVSLGNGLAVPIEQLQGNGVKVLTYDDNKKGIIAAAQTNWFNQGTKDCVQLTFSDGRTLVCTPDHRIRTERGDIQAADIKLKEDRIICGGDQPIVGPPCADELKWSLVTNGINFSAATDHQRSCAMAFLRIIGYVLTDGSISERDVDSKVYLGHQMDVDSFSDDIKLIVPDAKISCTFEVDRNLWVLALPNQIRKALISLPGIPRGSRIDQHHEWPQFVHTLPKALLREFIGGLFGGDGHALCLTNSQSKEKQKKGKKLYRLRGIGFSASSTNEHVDSLMVMMEQLKGWLVNIFGMDVISIGVQPKKGGKKQLHLRVADNSFVQFAKEIGFRHCVHKSSRLAVGVSHRRMVDTVSDHNRQARNRGYQIWRQYVDKDEFKPYKWILAKAIKELKEENPSFAPSFVTVKLTRAMLNKIHKGINPQKITVAPIDAKVWLNMIGAYHLFKSDDVDGDDNDDNNAPAPAPAPNVNRDMYIAEYEAWLKLPVYSLTVVNRCDVGPKQVYDISVPATELFIANGITVHNCGGLGHRVVECPKLKDANKTKTQHAYGYDNIETE